tara:strand:+ start:170 stop:733 length:564 start_codon:yes stop_codon:yes gene_type:complete
MTSKLKTARLQLAQKVLESLYGDDLDEGLKSALMKGGLAAGLAAGALGGGAKTAPPKATPTAASIAKSFKKSDERLKKSGMSLDAALKRFKDLEKEQTKDHLKKMGRSDPMKPRYRGDTGEGDLPKGTQPEDKHGGVTGSRKTKTRKYQDTVRGRYTRQDMFTDPRFRNFDLTQGKKGGLIGKPRKT